MAKYYVQGAKVHRNSNRFYGQQTAHDHNIEVAFSKAVRTYMERQYGVGGDQVEMDDIRSNVSRAPSGRGVVRLRYVGGVWGL
jgi:hypothetical protein